MYDAQKKFWDRVDKSGDCWIWQGPRQPAGYGITTVGGIRTSTHRLAYRLATGGGIPEGMFVCHHCDNPPCVRPTHLFLGTAITNMLDRDAKGRVARGDRSGRRLHPERYASHRGADHATAVLNDAAVLAIREAWTAGSTLVSLAAEHHVAVMTVWKVVHRETWTHLP